MRTSPYAGVSPRADLPDDPVRRAPPPWLVYGGIVLLLVVYAVLHRHGVTGWMEDLPIYQRAMHAFLAGSDPYAQVHYGLHFVYPPVVVYAISWLARLMPGESEWALLACIHLACSVATPFVLARFYFRSHWLTPALVLLIWLAQPDFTAVRALTSANVAPSLYLAALVAALPGLRRNQWTWFYAVVILAASVKVTFLLLLLFPLLAGRRQWLRSIATTLLVAAVYLAQKFAAPALYAGYKWALLQQIAVQQLYGYGVFGTAATAEHYVHHAVYAAYAVHVLFAGTLFGLLLWLRRRGAGATPLLDPSGLPNENGRIWLGLLTMSIIMINPRVLHYDIYLALFAAYIVLATTLKLEGWKLVAFPIALFLPGLIAFPHSRPWLVYQTYSACLILTALATGILQVWRSTAAVPQHPSGVPEPVVSLAR